MKNEKKEKQKEKHTFGWQKFLLLLAIYKHLLLWSPPLARLG
jgi:Co/Zn/Cd efflux system component